MYVAVARILNNDKNLLVTEWLQDELGVLEQKYRQAILRIAMDPSKVPDVLAEAFDSAEPNPKKINSLYLAEPIWKANKRQKPVSWFDFKTRIARNEIDEKRTKWLLAHLWIPYADELKDIWTRSEDRRKRDENKHGLMDHLHRPKPPESRTRNAESRRKQPAHVGSPPRTHRHSNPLNPLVSEQSLRIGTGHITIGDTKVSQKEFEESVVGESNRKNATKTWIDWRLSDQQIYAMYQDNAATQKRVEKPILLLDDDDDNDGDKTDDS
jgi:hypothetical protein